MFSRTKKFGLAALQKTVNVMQVKGVEPQPATMIAITSAMDAVGIPVTAQQEGMAKVSAEKKASKNAYAMAASTDKATKARVRQLEAQIQGVKSDGEARWTAFIGQEQWHRDEVDRVQALVDLLGPVQNAG